MADLNLRRLVAASGAAQTLTLAGTDGTDPVYDIVLTANCTLTLAGSAATPVRMQTLTAILRQDSTGNRSVVFPAGILWPSGFLPMLSVLPGQFDIVQFITFDGVTWMGFLQGVAMAQVGAIVTSVATGAPGATVTVSGTYSGAAPSSFFYQLDGGSFVAAGTTTINNGNWSFQMVNPSTAGTHTLAVRSSPTNVVSPTISYSVAAASGPSAVSAAGAGGNGNVAITATGTANGTPITSFNVQRSTSASSGFTQIGVATPTTSPASGVTTANYNDTTVTNGTPYYYKVEAVSTAGNVLSAATGAITASNTPALPTTAVPEVLIEAARDVTADGKGGFKAKNNGTWAGDWSMPGAGLPGPVLSATGWGGTKPTLVFSKNRYLAVEQSTRQWPTGSQPFYAIVFFTASQITEANTLLGSLTQGGGQFRVTAGGGIGFNRAGQLEINVSATGLVAVDTRYYATILFDGTSTTITLSGNAAKTTTVAPALGAVQMNAGHNGSSGTNDAEDHRGNISAIAFWLTPPSASDRTTWLNYLLGQYPLS